jgi:hypothetical protein
MGACQFGRRILLPHTFNTRRHGVRRIHASTCPSSRTSIPLNILHNLVRRELALTCAFQVFVYVGSVAFIARRDVDGLLQCLRVTWHDGAAVYHERWPIVSRECHDYAWHVLVAAWDGDAGVVVLGACYGFDAIGYYFAGLKAEAHAFLFVSSQSLGRMLVDVVYLLRPW